ncbi:hypothetical protein BGX34_008241, partial [Mortierella sp. NVP85]
MAFLGRNITDLTGVNWTSAVYMLDVAKRTWKQGPSAPKGFNSRVWAVSGDQLITWGYMEPYSLDSVSVILVFNMKTEKWVSKYVAPPRRPTATTYTLRPSQTPTQNTTSELGGTSSNTKSLAIIIVAVTGCLLAII